MRQAGRSLPEYRAVRERLDLFGICRRPDVCAEVTLQPVAAHGVDAAVIYSDIMLPVVGMGVGVEIVEGVGPVVAKPIRREADVEPADDARPRGVPSLRARVDPPRARRAASREGSRRLRRRAVHGRRLPRRRRAEPELHRDEAAHVRRAGHLARVDGPARGRVRGLSSPPRRRPEPTRSSSSTRGSGSSRPRTTASSSRRTRRACSPRRACRPSTSRQAVPTCCPTSRRQAGT